MPPPPPLSVSDPTRALSHNLLSHFVTSKGKICGDGEGVVLLSLGQSIKIKVDPPVAYAVTLIQDKVIVLLII